MLGTRVDVQLGSQTDPSLLSVPGHSRAPWNFDSLREGVCGEGWFPVDLYQLLSILIQRDLGIN